MTIYRYTDEAITAVESSTFSALGIEERSDLQRLLRDRIEIIAPNTMVIGEEFGEWDDSRRRIDLLALDKAANLVVIELKRTEDGGHMELQALRYAAMVSTITFEQAVGVFGSYLESRDEKNNAKQSILDFLGWEEPQEEDFARDVRIVLASAEFSKELTTAVLWLRERAIDIRCVRLKPYGTAEDTLLDVQQVVPLPEAEDYQVRVQRKSEQERQARASSRDNIRYRVDVNGESFDNLPKRRMIHRVITSLVEAGVSPDLLAQQITWRPLFFVTDGNLDSQQMCQKIESKLAGHDRPLKRWFTDDDELIYHDGKTLAVTNQWGKKTEEGLGKLLATTNNHGITVEAIS